MWHVNLFSDTCQHLHRIRQLKSRKNNWHFYSSTLLFQWWSIFPHMFYCSLTKTIENSHFIEIAIIHLSNIIWNNFLFIYFFLLSGLITKRKAFTAVWTCLLLSINGNWDSPLYLSSFFFSASPFLLKGPHGSPWPLWTSWETWRWCKFHLLFGIYFFFIVLF